MTKKLTHDVHQRKSNGTLRNFAIKVRGDFYRKIKPLGFGSSEM